MFTTSQIIMRIHWHHSIFFLILCYQLLCKTQEGLVIYHIDDSLGNKVGQGHNQEGHPGRKLLLH